MALMCAVSIVHSVSGLAMTRPPIQDTIPNIGFLDLQMDLVAHQERFMSAKCESEEERVYLLNRPLFM